MEPTTQEWIEALEKCLRRKWNALAEGKEPETYDCAVCNLKQKYWGDNLCIGLCVLNITGKCCNGTYETWYGTCRTTTAIPVRDFIASKLAELRLKRAREICRDDAETEKARQESAVHWGKIRDRVEDEIPSPRQCALCRRYNCTAYEDECGSCPIAVRTGRGACCGTPYKDARDAWKDRHGNAAKWVDELYGHPIKVLEVPEQRERFQAMIDYLEEMDPKYLDEPRSHKHRDPNASTYMSQDILDTEDKLLSKPATKPKGEKVLVPFRPHRTLEDVERWKDGRHASGSVGISNYYVAGSELRMGDYTNYGLVSRNEFRVPLDWRGPVPEWGQWIVPVVTGGPWHESGNVWEHWRDDESWCCSAEYRVHEGRLEARGVSDKWQETVDNYPPSDLVRVHLHAPRGWTGPVPEGCCLLDERVPVERVSREVMEGFAERSAGEHAEYFPDRTTLYLLHDDCGENSWWGGWDWTKVSEHSKHTRVRYAFLFDTDTHDHGPLDEERFFWAAGSEPKVDEAIFGKGARCET